MRSHRRVVARPSLLNSHLWSTISGLRLLTAAYRPHTTRCRSTLRALECEPQEVRHQDRVRVLHEHVIRVAKAREDPGERRVQRPGLAALTVRQVNDLRAMSGRHLRGQVGAVVRDDDDPVRWQRLRVQRIHGRADARRLVESRREHGDVMTGHGYTMFTCDPYRLMCGVRECPDRHRVHRCGQVPAVLRERDTR